MSAMKTANNVKNSVAAPQTQIVVAQQTKVKVNELEDEN